MTIARGFAAFAAFSTVVALALTTSSGGLAQTAPAPGNSGALTPAEARRRVDDITKDLREARAAAARVGDKALREKLERLLGQAELRARDLSEELARARAAQSPTPATMPLPAADLERLVAGLKKEPFDEGKLTFVENFAARRPLSCQQAATLLRCFTFDEGRVKAVKLLYPKLLDPQNFHDVLGVFVFDRSKAEARKSVGLK